MGFSIKEIQQMVNKLNLVLQAADFLQKLTLSYADHGGSVQFFRESLVKNHCKRLLTGELTTQRAVDWLESFNPAQYGFETTTQQSPLFPNGFESWQETHFEIVSVIQVQCLFKGSLSCQRHEEDGIGGLYLLAKEITNAFEMKNQDREWDGEFLDELEVFCRLVNL